MQHKTKVMRLSKAQGTREEQTETYDGYVEGVPELVTQRFAKSSGGVLGSAKKQVTTAHGLGLTLSIIIPVYNEEGYIRACLDSVATQKNKPLEVIVVDNNCTDKTIEIAKQYSFVKILTEKRQHQSFAQAAGFNSASGDILGRIDADSILPPDWTQKVIAEFENSKLLLAVTGGADPYDVLSKFLSVAGFNYYIFLAGKIAGVKLLWGSNCALRASAWQQIKDKVMLRPDIWEDYDMSFCLKPYGQVGFMKNNKVRVSFRALGTSYKKHISYQFQAVRTFYYRANIFRTLLFCVQWLGILIFYPLTFIDVWVVERKLAKASKITKPSIYKQHDA